MMDPLSKWMYKRSGPLAGSLTFLGLSMAWFSAFLYVCVQNGVSSTSFPEVEMPSRLFALGSVYGMQRPTIEVAWRTTCAGLFGMLALGVCDLLYARKTKARWFGLHTIANLWISALCLPDCWFLVSDPITALTTRSCNHWPTALVFSVHVYHVAFFRNLYFIDWLHHILMVVVGAPLLITGEMGPLMNFNNFFMCGLPGGLDYAMLYAVKHAWMSPLHEKRLNRVINVWFRAPPLVGVSVMVYIQLYLQTGVSVWVKGIRVFLICLGAWNGLFFMERVVGNYHVSAHKARESRKAAQQLLSPRQVQEASDYEHEEIVQQSGVPGMGLRIAVSSADLQALHREAEKVSYHFGKDE